MKVVNEWEINNKVIAVITNRAAYIFAAVRLMGFKHIPRFAHTSNLIVQLQSCQWQN